MNHATPRVWHCEIGAAESFLRKREAVDATVTVSAATFGPPDWQNEDGTAIVQLAGVMQRTADRIDYALGAIGTQDVERQLQEAAADASVARIVLLIDSPGGASNSWPDLAETIQDIDRNIKPVYAYSSGLMASAAYATATAARRIGAGPSAIVGSVGTIIMLLDASKALDEMGLRFIPVASGQFKAAGFMGAAVDDEQVEYFQGIVNDITQTFRTRVLAGRQLTAEQQADVFTAKVYAGPRAQAAGLVDEIATFNAFLKEVAMTTNNGPSDQPQAIVTADMTASVAVHAVRQQWPGTVEQLEQAAYDQGHDTGSQCERKRFADLVQLFGDDVALAAEQFVAGKTLDEARAQKTELELKRLREENAQLKAQQASGEGPGGAPVAFDAAPAETGQTLRQRAEDRQAAGDTRALWQIMDELAQQFPEQYAKERQSK